MLLKPCYTKREVLYIFAMLFDPAGWFAAVVFAAKILMQQMWLVYIKWDQALNPTALQ